MKTETNAQGIDYLIEPLTEDEARKMADGSGDGTIEVTVPVDLVDVAEGDYDQFLDMLNDKVLATGLICDICHSVVGATDDGLVLVKVTAMYDDYDR